ncbi:hypothetical protein CS562_07005 [Paenibacillus sp. LK1]|nr:hypothetical protein CS562_07005 [Paenibacillus sp. LK1]
MFLSQINDFEFIESDMDNQLKFRYLLNSITKFDKCKSNLKERNSIEFLSELSDQEIMILGKFMVIEYLSPKIISYKNLEQMMSTRDFSMTSQAAHLKQLMDIKRETNSEVENLVIRYTYNNMKLSKLR